MKFLKPPSSSFQISNPNRVVYSDSAPKIFKHNRTNIQDYDIKKLKLLQESFYKKLEEHNESNKSISRKNIDNTSFKVSHIPSDTVIKKDLINRSPFEHKRNKSTFETPLNTNQKNNSIIKKHMKKERNKKQFNKE